MTEPTVFGLPISVAFLYFIVYSVLGWGMETVYCSWSTGWSPGDFCTAPCAPSTGWGC